MHISMNYDEISKVLSNKFFGPVTESEIYMLILRKLYFLVFFFWLFMLRQLLIECAQYNRLELGDAAWNASFCQTCTKTKISTYFSKIIRLKIYKQRIVGEQRA